MHVRDVLLEASEAVVHGVLQGGVGEEILDAMGRGDDARTTWLLRFVCERIEEDEYARGARELRSVLAAWEAASARTTIVACRMAREMGVASLRVRLVAELDESAGEEEIAAMLGIAERVRVAR